jgi:hypothetical protein
VNSSALAPAYALLEHYSRPATVRSFSRKYPTIRNAPPRPAERLLDASERNPVSCAGRDATGRGDV